MIEPQMVNGIHISEAKRRQASSPVEVTASGPSPSRSIQLQNPIQARAPSPNKTTSPSANPEREQKSQTSEITLAANKNKYIQPILMCALEVA
jgi:hypothetical protein